MKFNAYNFPEDKKDRKRNKKRKKKERKHKKKSSKKLVFVSQIFYIILSHGTESTGIAAQKHVATSYTMAV